MTTYHLHTGGLDELLDLSHGQILAAAERGVGAIAGRVFDLTRVGQPADFADCFTPKF
jgi:hypothetical protein